MPDPFVAELTRKRTAKVKPGSAPRAADIDWSTIPRDRWVWAGTHVDEPYPCMCRQWMAVQGYTYCGRHCPCAGRVDVDTLPEGCCAVRPCGRPRTVVGPAPSLPPLSVLRPGKLRAPAPITIVDVIASL